MITAKHCKEVSVRVEDEVGALAKLTKMVAEKGINVLAAAAWIEGEKNAIIHLVTDDNLRVVDTLRAHGYETEEVASIIVELSHKPGMLSRVCEKVSMAGIGIRYLYVSGPINAETCLLVISTDNNDKALVALNG